MNERLGGFVQSAEDFAVFHCTNIIKSLIRHEVSMESYRKQLGDLLIGTYYISSISL